MLYKPIQIKEQLTRGLRRSHRSTLNSFELVECTNVKPSPSGLIPCGLITKAPTEDQLTDAGITIKFPWPQLFVRKRTVDGYVALLCDETAIYHVPIDPADPLVQIITYDASDLGELKDITSGGQWTFVDLHTMWVLFNGTCTVLYVYPHSLHTSFGDKAFVSDVKMNTGAFFQGRLYTAGYTGGTVHPFWGAVGNNVLIWPTSTGADTFFHYFPEITTLVDNYNEVKADCLDSRSCSNKVMDWQGPIYHIQPMLNYLLVYGAYGITATNPIEDPITGAQTVKSTEVSRVGIPSRGCVGGDKNNQVYIDTEGNLWYIDGNLKKDKLGYKEYMWQVLGGDIDDPNDVVISYDPSEEEFYISGGDGSDSASWCTFILNKNGMCRTSKIVTSIMVAPMAEATAMDYTGRLVGVYHETEENFPNFCRIRFETTDMGLRSLKTLRTFDIASVDLTDLKVGVQATYNNSFFPSGSYSTTFDLTETEWVEANDEGTVYTNITGLNFRILTVFYSDVYSKLDYLQLNWELADHRNRRGAQYVGKNVTSE